MSKQFFMYKKALNYDTFMKSMNSSAANPGSGSEHSDFSYEEAIESPKNNQVLKRCPTGNRKKNLYKEKRCSTTKMNTNLEPFSPLVNHSEPKSRKLSRNLETVLPEILEAREMNKTPIFSSSPAVDEPISDWRPTVKVASNSSDDSYSLPNPCQELDDFLEGASQLGGVESNKMQLPKIKITESKLDEPDKKLSNVGELITPDR